MTTISKLNKRHWHFILLSSLLMVLFFMGSASAGFRHGIPNDGEWRFKIDLHYDAEGNRFRYCQSSCANPDLRNGDFNDVMSSFTACNRSGRTIGISVQLWKGVYYQDLAYNRYITVRDGQCLVENLDYELNDKVSSYRIRQIY